MDVFIIILLVLTGIIGWLFVDYNDDAKIKKKYHTWFMVLAGILMISYFFTSWMTNYLYGMVIFITAIILMVIHQIKATSFCSSCGKLINKGLGYPDIRFCNNCGMKIDKVDVELDNEMKEKIKYYTRKILHILFFASIFLEIVYFTCKPLFGVEFLYGEAVYTFIFITLISSVIFVPTNKKYMMWIFYPLIIFAICYNFYLSIEYNMFSGCETSLYSSPNYQNTLVIQKGGFLSTYYKFYSLKGFVFKRKFNDSDFVVPYTGAKLDFNAKYKIKSVTWSDECNVKVLYSSVAIINGKLDKHEVEDNFIFPHTQSDEYQFNRKGLENERKSKF